MKEDVLNRNDFHSRKLSDIYGDIGSGVGGISAKEAKKRLDDFGVNEIPSKNNYSYLIAFFRQLKSIFIYVLLIAIVLSYYLGHLLDVYVLSTVIVINLLIGFFQERRAEKSIEALKKLVVSHVKVIRDGRLINVESREIVVGDVIILEEGDKIPADARLIKVSNFKTVEASLTGESLPIEKIVGLCRMDIPVADRKNMVFSGTFVASGTARALIVKTGINTEVGKIAKSIGAIKRRKTHFQRKVDKLALQMGILAIIGALITFGIGYFFMGFEFSEIFLFSLASLIGGIPEGLPAILSVVLAVGAVRMAKKNAIMRNLPSSETLGIVDTIITDKTGTLTQNIMTVTKIFVPGKGFIDISGNGWEPLGEFSIDGKSVNPLESSEISKLLYVSSMSNDSRILSKGNEYSYVGDPTEAALVVLAQKAGLSKFEMEKEVKNLDEFPFDAKLKYSANLFYLKKEKQNQLFIMGAPEIVLDKCRIDLKDKKKFHKILNEMTSDALRVVAVAYKKQRKDSIGDVDGLDFLGFVGMIDPPRIGVKESVAKARNAGIRIIMATGDHKNTAVAIAKQIGIVNSSMALDETELSKLSDREFRKAVMKVNVFTRLTPNMKLRIAETLQEQGCLIAMTGDGVNDAPALKRADIGISMGKTGTDVAKESSEMVLADDDFSTIINAIEEGRTVFRNVKRTSFFLVTTNIAEYLGIILPLIFRMPLPLLPTQLLWLNLVTDTGPAIGLATEPLHKDVLKGRSVSNKDEILNKDIIPMLIFVVLPMVALTVGIFYYYLPKGINEARSAAFLAMAFTQLYNSFNVRSIKDSIFSMKFFENKALLISVFVSLVVIVVIVYVDFFSNLFKFEGISVLEFVVIFVLSGIVLVAGEVSKVISRNLKV